ncbi:response regulator transcription factor [Rummeliibacillus sp. G93]|uniref:response regulator transcription factor n=1 Tax=Rummeliibacillus TaxID=648802 RepID=UPI001167340E|nr:MULTISPECIES: response regulator transcription factor [Rummeliibacillus]MBB5171694.1 DNA-binding response OmpR family regulator [Rummeliibacillus stabekisii]UQW97039.1 response regulator transcription factor [Rummeliibacillus sp. G93]GEL06301.1 DNA-binding response regulator [Rummeliibacillus stabekisii]
MMNILIVDDDINILQVVDIHLTESGYKVLQAKDGNEALRVLNEVACDLAVVDVMMPFIDGYTLTKEIRKKYNIPIILLTAKNQIEDKEEGFRSGTDDYLVKPFEMKELRFRIEALLRRYNKQTDDTIVRLGNTTINKNKYEVQMGERTLILPLKEFELLHFLASNPMHVFSRDQIIEQIWGLNYEGDERTVDVHIKRLRERFSKSTDDFQIKTVRGVGYLLEANPR